MKFIHLYLLKNVIHRKVTAANLTESYARLNSLNGYIIHLNVDSQNLQYEKKIGHLVTRYKGVFFMIIQDHSTEEESK